MTKSTLEEQLLFQIRAVGLPDPEREYRFHDKRRWRFDFAYPDDKIAIEVEGGVWSRGRHTRGSGFIADCEKYNAAAELEWCVLRFPGDMINSGEAIKTIERVVKNNV
jgi:very-short-patch-repair endonuclease